MRQQGFNYVNLSMIGLGAGNEMMKAFKANRNSLKKSNAAKDKFSPFDKSTNHLALKFKTSSPEALEKFKEELKRAKKRDQTQRFIVLTFFVALAIVLLLLFKYY